VSDLVAEVESLVSETRRAWRRRGAGAFTFTFFVATAIVVVWLLDHTHDRTFVAVCCNERVGEPIGGALLRLPGSMVAPAPLLPVWGSLLQVLLAFGLCEAIVGPWRTMVIAFVSNIVATLAGRSFVWWIPTRLGGLPLYWLRAIDTGPSAATAALAVFVGLTARCPRLGGAVVAGLLVELYLRPDLAAREHVVAIVVGAMCAAIPLLATRRDGSRRLEFSFVELADA
jgi:hypothetical protein